MSNEMSDAEKGRLANEYNDVKEALTELDRNLRNIGTQLKHYGDRLSYNPIGAATDKPAYLSEDLQEQLRALIRLESKKRALGSSLKAAGMGALTRD